MKQHMGHVRYYHYTLTHTIISQCTHVATHGACQVLPLHTIIPQCPHEATHGACQVLPLHTIIPQCPHEATHGHVRYYHYTLSHYHITVPS